MIIHGDCLEEMKNIPDKSIDMILCDLPYGTTSCRWDTIIPFEPLWVHYKRIIKDNGAIVLTASQPFTSALVMSNPKMFKYEWVWNKIKPSGFQNAKYMPMRKHENILVFGKNINYFPQKEKLLKPRKSRQYSKSEGFFNGKNDSRERIYIDKNPQTILEFSNANQLGKFHPTQKPVALFEYLIKTYTKKGDTVLDNCAGSGTTGIAAQNLNRKYILIEKEKEYIDIIKQRLASPKG